MIESTYLRLWQLETRSDFPSHISDEDLDTDMAIFNMIFALVCQMENEEESADHFYQKSRHSYAIDAIDEPSLKTVQLLVLTGIYLQSTKFASRCWFVVGSAIRYAHYLGLDVKDEELSSRAEHGYVTRRRGIFRLTKIPRLLSLSFNRKSMTCEDIGIDLPQITQCDDSGNAESSHIPPFIKYSVTLFEIMNKTLVHIYHQASHENRLKDNLPHWWNRPQLANILSQTQALDDLCSGMPDHLNPDSTETRTAGLFAEEIGWQSYVFRSRFLYVRILILRPLLLSAAIANVRHMHRDLNSNNSSRFTIEEGTARATTFKMAKWREFHYAFVCAISISIARLCSFDSDSFREYQLNKSWDLCVDILHHYKPRIESAQRAMDILDCLNSQVAKVMKDGLYGTNPQPSQPEVPNEEHSSSLFGLTGFMDENSSMGSFDPYGLDYAWLNSEVGGLGWLGG
ncbi:hypothetical protein N7456_001152 [Penicillium angulare]|uniref:Xylanolytic transcriptional activator regulatory domain-containing protein n=1 Tax=Penicillium angulare TaxID=116970 RepID=A0A9W9GDD8_9EURO|nr:hypothetical protein N7456_001152 [Penicillium angulare]